MTLFYIRKGEDKGKVQRRYTKLKEKMDREERENSLSKKLSRFKTPRILRRSPSKSRLAYRQGNPLKRILPTKNKTVITVGR